MHMTIGVLRESDPETRVSLLPEHLATFKKMNVSVALEEHAGEQAYATDDSYRAAGASITSREGVIQQADVLLSINLPAGGEPGLWASKVLLGNYTPLFNFREIKKLADVQATVFSIDMIPRTTRAQTMDVLSSQANIAGYKAVLVAANMFPHYFPMFMTAAGSIPPARVLVLGAGVAGLQAVATARRLGAVVEVFDTRPAVREEVMSLGARFVEVEGAADASKAGGYAVEQSAEFQERQKRKIAERVAKSDIIITTAQIPGKKAPVLVTEDMLAPMKEGSVIIDLAAATGGNTALTRDRETVVHHGIRIVGDSLLPASMPYDASKMYGKNIQNFLALITGIDGSLHLNFDDDLVRGTCMAHGGKIVNERVQSLLG